MGWFREDPRHEGYVVGLVDEEITLPGAAGDVRAKVLRELSYYRDHDRDVPPEGLRVQAFQVGCECGWRSPRFLAPINARWHPHVLELGDEWTENRAREVWGRHYDEETRRPLVGSLAYVNR